MVMWIRSSRAMHLELALEKGNVVSLSLLREMGLSVILHYFDLL